MLIIVWLINVLSQTRFRFLSDNPDSSLACRLYSTFGFLGGGSSIFGSFRLGFRHLRCLMFRIVESEISELIIESLFVNNLSLCQRTNYLGALFPSAVGRYVLSTFTILVDLNAKHCQLLARHLQNLNEPCRLPSPWCWSITY